MSTAVDVRVVDGERAVGAAPTAPSARERLLPRLPDDGLWGWLGPLTVTLVAAVLRFWELGEPSALVFDETHYVPDAEGLLDYGVEYDAVEQSPDFVVHPPVGKWVIAAGMQLFERDAFGWRFGVAVLGALSVLLLARVARRMFRSTLLGCAAGLLLALDGLHFVHSRSALLDLILMFWVLAAFGCLVVDRDTARGRLASLGPASRRFGARLGPGLGARPWRLAAGVCLGLACGTKWSGLYFVAAFGLLTVAWDVGARRTAGVRSPLSAMLVRDAVPAFLSLVGVALVVYLVSWTGWFLSDAEHAYARGWAGEHPEAVPPLVPAALASLWHYHHEMWGFHRNLTTAHAYESNPWGWMVLARPTSFYYEGPVQGEMGCEVDRCSSAITGLGTPMVWWAGVLALVASVGLWLGRRDWRAGAALAGVAAGYLPWFFFQDRTIFSFYTVVFLPFVVLAIVLCLGLTLGPAAASPGRRAVGATLVGAYLLLVIGNFAWLYPVLSAQVVPYAEWAARMWFPSWI